MRFATNCATAYARATAPTRRRFNQAVFTRIDIRDGKIADVEYHPPFELLFSSSEFEYGDLVEVAGIEPASFGTSPGLLRAQPALLFSAPAVMQASRRAGSAAVRCPVQPRGRARR
jgi:hypothetical protein